MLHVGGISCQSKRWMDADQLWSADVWPVAVGAMRDTVCRPGHLGPALPGAARPGPARYDGP